MRTAEFCSQACLLYGQGSLAGAMGKEGEPVPSHQTCDFSVNPSDSCHAWIMYDSF